MRPLRPWLVHQSGPALEDVAHPEQRLDIVDQGRPAEQADLERVGRLVPRQAALALDALDQRRFLAADIGAGAAPQLHARGRQPGASAWRSRARRISRRRRVFVAQVDVDVRRLDDMRADQRAFEEAVRVGVEDSAGP